MKTITMLVGILILASFLTAVLYIIFGQVTVRKLRKNPETRENLGMELLSGWDIINVAQALAIPKVIMRKLENSPISFLYANTDLLRKYTNRFDRLLASLFYWLLMGTGLFSVIILILDSTGFI